MTAADFQAILPEFVLAIEVFNQVRLVNDVNQVL